MRRTASAIVVALLGVAAALGLKAALGGDAAGFSGDEFHTRPSLTPSGSTAGFYLDLPDSASKVALARRKLGLLTSGAPSALGPLRDDMALLCDEPAVIDLILESFARRAHLSRFEGSAFGDLFERVRNRRFVEPLIQLFESSEPQVRAKAIRAAATQADPRLTEYLDRIYVEARKGVLRGAGSRERVILAAERCGGELAPAIFRRGLHDPAVTVSSYAADVVGKLGLRQFIPDLRLLLEAKDSHLRIRAAMSLARMRDAEGVRVIQDMLDPRDTRMASDAAAVIRELKLAECADTLRSLLPHVGLELRVAFAGTLVVLGDPATLRQMVAGLQHPNELRRKCAITVVAASGAAEHAGALARAIDAFGPGCYQGVSLGLTWAARPDITLVKRLVQDSPQPHDMMDVVMRVGDALVPWLASEIATARERSSDRDLVEQRIMGLAVMLARIGTPRARDALLASRKHHRRLIEEALRQIDLSFRRRGLAP